MSKVSFNFQELSKVSLNFPRNVKSFVQFPRTVKSFVQFSKNCQKFRSIFQEMSKVSSNFPRTVKSFVQFSKNCQKFRSISQELSKVSFNFLRNVKSFVQFPRTVKNFVQFPRNSPFLQFLNWSLILLNLLSLLLFRFVNSFLDNCSCCLEFRPRIRRSSTVSVRLKIAGAGQLCFGGERNLNGSIWFSGSDFSSDSSSSFNWSIKSLTSLMNWFSDGFLATSLMSTFSSSFRRRILCL